MLTAFIMVSIFFFVFSKHFDVVHLNDVVTFSLQFTKFVFALSEKKDKLSGLGFDHTSQITIMVNGILSVYSLVS